MDVTENIFAIFWAWLVNKTIRTRPATAAEVNLAALLSDSDIQLGLAQEQIGRLRKQVEETDALADADRKRSQTEIEMLQEELGLLSAIVERDRLRVRAEASEMSKQIAINSPKGI